MIEYRICSDYAVLITEGGMLENGELRIAADLPDGDFVKLYGCGDGEIYEAPIEGGVATFEKGVIRQGFSYDPEFISTQNGSVQRIPGCALSAVEIGDKVYIVRKAGNAAYEFAKMWKTVALAFESAKSAEECARQALDQVSTLARGYRTE